jgi:hypothetical protein
VGCSSSSSKHRRCWLIHQSLRRITPGLQLQHLLAAVLLLLPVLLAATYSSCGNSTVLPQVCHPLLLLLLLLLPELVRQLPQTARPLRCSPGKILLDAHSHRNSRSSSSSSTRGALLLGLQAVLRPPLVSRDLAPVPSPHHRQQQQQQQWQ